MGENRSLSNGQEGNVPKLRFPGFEGEWTKKRLSEVATGFDYGMNAAAIKFDGTNQYIRITDIDDESRCYNQSNPVSPAGILDEKYLVGVNDILFARTGASTGKSYLYKETDGKLYFAGFLIRVTVNAENNSIFVFNTTLTQKYNKWVQLTSMRSGQPGINSQEYASYTDFYPMLNEQNKIAKFLNMFELRISKQRQLIETLKKYKRGLLSAIFPEKDKATPIYRLSEFTEPWEQRKAVDIAEYSKGNGYSKSDLTESGTPIILYGRLYTKYQFVINEVDTFAIPKASAVYSQGNEVIIPASGETAEDIARASAVEKPGVLLGGDLNILRPFDFINPSFLALAISSGEPQKELEKRAQGKSVVHIHNSDIQEIIISYPARIEQDQIVAIFRRLDHLITLHQRELELFTKYKLGLLQQLFI